MSEKITIYTDGSSQGNPGPGGYGIVLKSGPHRKEISEGYTLTTNNRMELLAVIIALEALKNKNSIVDVFTDSRYVVDAIEKKWLFEKGNNRPSLTSLPAATGERFLYSQRVAGSGPTTEHKAGSQFIKRIFPHITGGGKQ